MTMLRFLLCLGCLLPSIALAQLNAEWNRLRQYGTEIGIDSLCNQPDAACLKAYFTQIIYGKPSPRLGYQGLPEQLDTARLNRLTRQFLAGADWCPLLDSMESHDRTYRQLKAYCIRCLIDDYMADSLTLEQVKSTLHFYRWLNRFPADKRVIVNIASATLRVLDREGTTLLNSRVIVGKPGTPTPLFNASITNLITYPYWNVPRSIAVNELLPKIWKNPGPRLADLNLQVIDGWGRIINPNAIPWATLTPKRFPYRLRQSTGCDNALGVLKFTVTDPYDIYLHDTNQRSLFASENRALSHGCIRVAKPAELANLLLGTSRFDAAFLVSCQKQANPKTIPLPRPIPIVVTYNALDIDEQGAIVVYRDVYDWWPMSL